MSGKREAVAFLAVDNPNRTFQRVATVVTAKLGEIFKTNVLILDENQNIAIGPPEVLGQPFEAVQPQVERTISIPFFFGNEPVEVVICNLAEDEMVSSHLAQAVTEMVINEIASRNGHASQIEAKQKFVHNLLFGQVEDETKIYQQAAQLGLDLEPPRSVILINAADHILSSTPLDNQAEVYARHRSQRVIRAIVNYFHLPNDLICAYMGDGEIVILKAADSNSLADWANGNGRHKISNWADLAALKRATTGLVKALPGWPGRAYSVGIGRYHPGLKGLARSYEDARTALKLGQRFNPDKYVHCLDELGVAAFVGVAEERTKIDLALHLLSPLDDEPELLKTMEVFFEMDSYPSKVAVRLSIHRNTLSYRLEKVAQLTGLDPRRFDDAVQIRLALILRTMDDKGYTL